MAPFIGDKSRGRIRADVQYYDEWPMRQPSLLFAGLALRSPDYVGVWNTLKADSDVEEVVPQLLHPSAAALVRRELP